MYTACRTKTIPHIYSPEYERQLRRRQHEEAALPSAGCAEGSIRHAQRTARLRRIGRLNRGAAGAQRRAIERMGKVVVLAEFSWLLFKEENHRAAEE